MPLDYNAGVDPAVIEMRAAGKADYEKFNPVPKPVIEGAVYRAVLDNETLELGAGDVVATLESKGFAGNGFSISRVLRPEIQGRPVFDGLLCPMFDGFDDAGVPIVRYETPAAHDMLLRAEEQARSFID